MGNGTLEHKSDRIFFSNFHCFIKAIYKMKSKANKVEVWISVQQFWLTILYVEIVCTIIII